MTTCNGRRAAADKWVAATRRRNRQQNASGCAKLDRLELNTTVRNTPLMASQGILRVKVSLVGPALGSSEGSLIGQAKGKTVP